MKKNVQIIASLTNILLYRLQNPILIAQWQNGVTRKDMVETYSFAAFKEVHYTRCVFFYTFSELLVENVYIKTGMKIVVHIMVNISNLVWCFSMDIYIYYI